MTTQLVSPKWEERKEYYRGEMSRIMDANQNKAGALIRILQQSQELVGYLAPDMLEIISERLAIPVAQVYGVVSFYNFFSMVPKGKYVIQVCTGTSCYVKGGQKIIEAFDKKFNLKPRGITDDGLYSLETVRCLGACGLSPVLSINGEIHGRVKVNNLEDILNAYK